MYTIRMLPDRLLKRQMRTMPDPKRVIRIIRILGATNLLLGIALFASWAWFLKLNKTLNVYAVAESFAPPLRVEMPMRTYSEHVAVGNGDILRHPVLTVYGKVRQYEGLRETLDGFYVSVHGEMVYPKPITGEFAEKILLNPGRNVIDVEIHWGGAAQYKYSYIFTYVPEPADPGAQGDGMPNMPIPAL